MTHDAFPWDEDVYNTLTWISFICTINMWINITNMYTWILWVWNNNQRKLDLFAKFEASGGVRKIGDNSKV